jgi:hypothetical protein
LQNIVVTDASPFVLATFQKLSVDTIYIGKTSTNKTYIFDVNGNWKTVQSTNASKLTEFIYG